MQVAALPPSVYRAANSRPTPELSPLAANRLTLIGQWEAMRGEGITAAKAADILRVPRASLYRWNSRLRKRGLRGLEPDSRRPRNVRRPQREPGHVKAVLAQRTAPPWFGKDKVAVLLRKKGWKVSASAVGRIIAEAKHRGVLREPPRPGVARRKSKPIRPYAVRKPSAYRPTRPGDLVQIDTLDVRPLPGVILKHFTARDVVSRCDVLQVGTQATSASAARFMEAVVERMPFPVRAIQVAGAPSFRGRSRRPAGRRASCCSFSRRLPSVRRDVDALNASGVVRAIGQLVHSHLRQLNETHRTPNPMSLLYRFRAAGSLFG